MVPRLVFRGRPMICVSVCVNNIRLLLCACVVPFPAVLHSIWQLVAGFSNVRDTRESAIVVDLQ